MNNYYFVLYSVHYIYRYTTSTRMEKKDLTFKNYLSELQPSTFRPS